MLETGENEDVIEYLKGEHFRSASPFRLDELFLYFSACRCIDGVPARAYFVPATAFSAASTKIFSPPLVKVEHWAS